ncbi:oxygen-independent coproporphyrinogen-3 oxidase [Bacillus thermophilus]|uniref:Heme chaperone HemW n=1 Tax=Siminovitchia thermophila TaxID=1245522 RepID=A0ABS2R9K0_9BACI|nr:radical SAM family heme chaperone HemW [Siminovitchia thermophila]MBM7716322.1 oxygen-independent coproporphyrinogen-3 oxidase [Siminovitchia thermophila]
MKAAYIHIPFCEHICHYCDFNKFYLHTQPVDEYLDMLEKEFSIYSELYPYASLETVFVGGGTPTSLNERQLETLCKAIKRHLPYKEGEFTFEANPGDLSEEKLKILKSYGVNRLSIGVQSFNDELLEKIGRSHRAADVYRSVDLARKEGFTNISIDLIYALPGQTEEDFLKTIREALALELPHYSGYSLIVEPKTVFYNLLRKGKLKLPGEELEARMYEDLMDSMEKNGLCQYEISNFSKPGFESKHNLVYWNNEPYFGFGAGAHGYVNAKRYANYGPLKKYMEPLAAGTLPIFTEHEVTPREAMEEEMFLGLRKKDGVNMICFQDKFSAHPKEVFGREIARLISKQLLTEKGDRLQLTKQGLFLGNEVFQSFLTG